MKQGSFNFWILFSLFFAIPFPMILYYTINSDVDVSALKQEDPWLALGILGLSVLLWIILLIRFFNKWILNVFRSKHNIEKLKREGLQREAKILKAVQLSKAGARYETYELMLSFKNLAGTEINQVAGVNDARPYEHRFEVGKKVDLLLDKDLKGIPYFIFSSTEARIKKGIIGMIFIGWLSLLMAIMAYYLFSYQLESHGAGWRFMSFGHPLLLCPVILVFYGLLGYLIGRFSGQTKQAVNIKFKGLRARARLLNARQTGLYINEQPNVEFLLEYTDEQQQVHQVSFKRIVDLLDLHVTRQEYIDIFYLKEDPSRIAFASDLEEIN
jgi:hypothetical protein